MTFIILSALALSHLAAGYIGYLVGDGHRYARLLRTRRFTKIAHLKLAQGRHPR